MDKNDILNRWDKIQSEEKRKQKESGKNQVSHKKANAPTKEEKALAEEKDFNKRLEKQINEQNSTQINPMELWLRRYGTIDKDKLSEETQERQKFQDRNYLVSMKCEAFLDLHGLHQDEAESRLNNFITDCKNRGLKKVMIIHGKGIHTSGTDPVLGKLVRSFIERDKRCGASGHPKNKAEGGTGATWVILK